jgi:PKD repeat protein
MTTDFYVLCATTVPETYFWDLGTPLETAPTNTPAYITSNYVSGYAPGVQVIFANNSVSDQGYDFIDFTWNFGDYYHDDNNFVSLSCTSLTLHTYIMPGTYNVTLRHIQSRGRVELDQTGNAALCRGKYGIRWFWDEVNCLTPLGNQNPFATTWDEVSCGAPKEKWWDFEEACFQKYCKAWSWYDLNTENQINPVKWFDTISDGELEKKWMFEANDTICRVTDAEFLNTTETIEQNAFNVVVEVKEIMPVAGMHSVSATIGTSPLTVQLTPRNCKPGSFPIDRIDWDFGDGSPIKTIIRYNPITNDPNIINTEYFISDPDDVRNYDVIHTYTRNKDTYPVFYPSLTCYSACTNSHDSCCLTVGPISFLESSARDIHLLKTRNTLKGNIYALAVDKSISLTTTSKPVKTIIPEPNIPKLVIRDTKDLPQNYFGYNGDNFPQIYTPDCSLQFTGLPPRFLTTQDSTPFIPTDNLNDNGQLVVTEFDIFIYP